MRARCRGRVNLTAAVIAGVLLLLIVTVFIPQFQRMRSGVYRLSCAQIRRNLETAAQSYHQSHTRSLIQEGRVVDQDTLKAAGFLLKVQQCPLAGKFTFAANGKVLCSVHSQEATPGGAGGERGAGSGRTEQAGGGS